MKQTYYSLILCMLMFSATTVFAQPANDNCTTAQSLGTLPAPAPCGTATTGTKNGTVVTVAGTNATATPSNPYPYISACTPGNLLAPPNDVWYSFVASSYQTRIAITGAAFANPVITVWEGSCNGLGGIGCVTGAANAATLTVLALTPGNTYYVQVSGLDNTQNGTFTMKLTSQTDCANCLVASTTTATPPPTNGFYQPGTTVTFCDSIYQWNQTSSNWLHGVQVTFGPGWDQTTLVPGVGPPSCSGTPGVWGWYPGGDTSSNNGSTWGPGFYYETTAGSVSGVIDGNPGNNYGDDDINACSWKFCVTITTKTACTPGVNLNVVFSATGDGQDGSWTSVACQNDPVTDLYAVGSCCPPTMTSTPATCANPTAGTATATPSGTYSPWTFQWSNGVTQTGLTGPSTITGLSAGNDTVTVTDALNCTISAVVNVGGPPPVNAGPSQNVNCVGTFPGGSATMAAVGSGTWTAQAGNPGTATITTPGSATTTITNFSAPGTYTFIWTVSGCVGTTTVVVTAKPNAGPDKTVTCAILPGGSATMAGTGTGTWTAQAGNPGTATITTPTSPTTSITTFSAAGTYKFIWTNGSCSDTANVVVTAKPSAGPDQTVTCITLPGGSATMAGTGTGTWTAQAGNPGTATITTPASPTTTITTFSAAGTYNFIWTNGSCTDTAAVIVTAKPNAGPDKTISCITLPGGSVTMAATGTGTWTALGTNPGTATITTPASPTTTITTFSAAGTYNFVWTNGTCTDTAAVIVTAKPNAGPDKTVSCVTLPGGSATMAATGTGTWTAQAGNPGTATITTPASATTTITTFSAAGTYNFIWTSNGCTDTAAVIVSAKSSAGPDKTISCVTLPGGSVTMAATGAGTWTAQAGNPGTATITTPASATTTITTFSVAGTYNFIWTSGGCTDTAAVIVSSKANAGPDQTVSCAALPGGSATMAATGTGTWTAQAGNPGTATITTPASATTTITTFSVAGTYNFIWTSSGCADTAAVIVTAKPNAGPNQTVSCVTLPGGSATMAATGTGTWTAQAGNPGTATITTPASPTTTITTFSAIGTYNFIWTNGSCTDTAAVIVSAKANAGPDQFVTCFPINSSATMAATGAGTWTAQAGNPGTATITTPASATTTITAFSVAGTYNFIWTSGGCTDTAAVIVTTKPNAGPDKTVNCINLPGGSATMAAVGAGTWTAQAGNPGTATITTPASPTTTITTFSAAGTYNFIWTSGSCSDTAAVTVTAKPNAGPDQTITCAILPGGSATMAATGTGTWTAQAGNPGTATITTPASATTTITTFSAAGTYNFVWTNGSGCTDTAAVIVTAKPNAGADQTVNCAVLPGGTATMAATGTGTWTAQAGNPGTATITTPTSPTTTIKTFSIAGTYNFIWTNASGCADTAAVTVTAKPSAGPDQTVSCIILPGGTATMAATGTGTWTALGTNPGTATITTPASATTTITTFSAAGTYNFIWTNGSCSDTAAVIVTAKPNAGPDQTVTCAVLPGGTATMAATGTGTWTAQAGNPGTATITTPTSPTTTIKTFSAAGTYNFIWTSGGCTDTASIVVTAKPNAGPDQTVSCVILPGGSATMAATGTGTWTELAGNPGTDVITSPNSATTTITTFSTVGTYYYIWTNGSGCTDTAAVIVTAKPNAGPDQSLTCFPINNSVTMAATGTGTWTAQAGNPGTAVITTPANPTTTITTFSVVGTYNFIWTSGGCKDTASVTVTPRASAGPDQTVSCALLPGGSATMAASGTGTWTALGSNPGTATITTPASATTTITTFSVAGTYNFVWSSGGCTDTAAVIVTAKPDAGPDQSLTCFPINNSVTMAATGTGTWTAQAGNPGTAVITTPANPTTTITTFSVVGTYNFIWTSGGCKDTASVTVTPRASAGPDQTVSCALLPGGSATMAASGTGTWTALGSNPGTATITTPASATTTITTFSVAGTYNFVWSSGGCIDTAAVIVTAKPDAGPDQTVSCVTLPGGSATMAASGTGTWTAQAGNPGIATITTPTSATTTITTFSVAGTYNFIWTSGGCKDTASVIVTAKPNAGPDQSICQNIVATMAATGTGTWTAIPGNPAATTITNPASATTTISGFSTTGTYSFQWTSGSCSDTVNINVNPLPSPTVNNDTICSGNTAILTATGGVSYVWSTAAATPSITVSTAGTYTVTATGANGCTATASGTLTVKPLPTPTVNNATVCSGNSATLTATGGVSYIWSNSATTPTITVSVAGAYTVTATGVNGCTATASGILTVNPLPAPFVNDASVCSGNSATLTAGGGVSYIWSTTATTPSITVNTAGTYTVTATDANGCSATASGTVTVNALPNITVNDSTVCAGNSAILTASGAVSYVWSTTAATPSISVSIAGTYTVTGTDANGCTATGAGILNVNPLPTPTVNNASACIGDSAVLIVTGGAVSYIWSTSATGTSIVVNTAGTYTVTATGSDGCTAAASAILTINPLPTPTVNNATVCFGNNATLNATGGVAYVWSNSATTPSISVATAGTYTVTATDGNGCSATASGSVVVNPLPTPSVNDSTVCAGNSAILTATGGVSYVWSTTATTPGISVAIAGTYTVTATDANSCSATASGTLTVNPVPTPAVNNAAVCFGDSAVLTVTGAASSYVWSTTSTSTSITVSTAGTYTVTATAPDGCTAAASGILTVHALPTPTVNNATICEGVSATLTATGGVSYVWSTAAITASITDTAAGTYTVTATDANGCSATASGTITVIPKPYAGLDSTICQNATAGLNAIGSGTWSSLPTNPAATTITTSGSASTTVTGFSAAGSYGYVWTVNGCTDTAFVIVNALPTLAPTVRNITCTNATGVIYANAAGSSPFIYQWSDATTADSLTTTTSGIPYTVTVTDHNQCSASATATVNNQIIVVGVADSLTNVSCYGYNNGKIVLYVTPAGQFTYAWSNGESTDSISGLAPGTYNVVVTDSNGCTKTESYTILSPTQDFLNVTPSDTLITLGDTIQLNSTLTGVYPATSYAWTPVTSWSSTSAFSCTNCPNPTVIPTDTLQDVYQLVVTYYNGCSVTVTDTIRAKAHDVSGIPDAFSPNGDGKNDQFVILATGVKDFKMNIYNRWGQLVFETTDLTRGWDGNYKGSPQPSEAYTYFYTITYLDGKVEVKEGSFMLFR